MGVPRQQGAADLLCQPGDVLADGGLAESDLPGGECEAFHLGDSNNPTEQNGVVKAAH